MRDSPALFASCSPFVRSLVRVLFGFCSALVRHSAARLRDIMNTSLQGILSGLPEKKSRSRLETFGDLIHLLIRHGSTYREIAAILRTKCDIHASISTIHDFVRRRAATARMRKAAVRAIEGRPGPRKDSSNALPVSGNPQAEEDEVKRRIAELKLRRPSTQVKGPTFEYDPSEPLHIPTKPRS
jgi:hypothetical protein